MVRFNLRNVNVDVDRVAREIADLDGELVPRKPPDVRCES